MVWLFPCRGKLCQHSRQPSCHLSAWWMHVKEGQCHRVMPEMDGHQLLSDDVKVKICTNVLKKQKQIRKCFNWKVNLKLGIWWFAASFHDRFLSRIKTLCWYAKGNYRKTLLPLWEIFWWLLQPVSCGADGKIHRRILIIDQLRLGLNLPFPWKKGNRRWMNTLAAKCQRQILLPV